MRCGRWAARRLPLPCWWLLLLLLLHLQPLPPIFLFHGIGCVQAIRSDDKLSFTSEIKRFRSNWIKNKKSVLKPFTYKVNRLKFFVQSFRITTTTIPPSTLEPALADQPIVEPPTISPLSPIRYHFSPWVNEALLKQIPKHRNASSFSPSANNQISQESSMSGQKDCDENPDESNSQASESTEESPRSSFQRLSCAERKLLRDLQLQEKLRVHEHTQAKQEKIVEKAVEQQSPTSKTPLTQSELQLKIMVDNTFTHSKEQLGSKTAHSSTVPSSIPPGPSLADQLLRMFQLLSKGEAGQRRLQQQFSRLNQFATWKQQQITDNEQKRAERESILTSNDPLGQFANDFQKWQNEVYEDSSPLLITDYPHLRPSTVFSSFSALEDSLQPHSQCLPLLPTSIAEICDEVDQFSSIKYVINSVRRADPRLTTAFPFQRLYAANEQRLRLLLYDYGLSHCSKYSLWSLLSPSSRAQLLGLPVGFSLHRSTTTTANSSASTNSSLPVSTFSSRTSTPKSTPGTSSPYQMRIQCRAVLSELWQLDQLAKQQYCEFDRMLSRYYCQQYSVKSSCSDCRVSKILSIQFQSQI